MFLDSDIYHQKSLEKYKVFKNKNQTGHSTIRAIQAVRITVRLVRILMCVLDKTYSIH